MKGDAEKQLTVSVIVPTFRRLDMLKKCLAGVMALTVIPAEIIIPHRPDVDPETTTWLRQQSQFHPEWKLIELTTPGVVDALNAGIALASGAIIAIFDDDAIPRSDWLSRILIHYHDPGVAAVGGRDVVHSCNKTAKQPDVHTAGVFDFWGNWIGNHHLVVGEARHVDILKGCNWSLRRSAIGSLRLDTRLPGTGAQPANDYWFCANLRRAGWRLTLDPAAIVDHYPAHKPDYQHDTWGARKCHDWTCGEVATCSAFMSAFGKSKYLTYYLLFGRRNCPGLYFILHSLLKRPRALPGMLRGGWNGFVDGIKLGRVFRDDPPGSPNPPPTSSISA